MMKRHTLDDTALSVDDEWLQFALHLDQDA
jgi:hypothetical protein